MFETYTNALCLFLLTLVRLLHADFAKRDQAEEVLSLAFAKPVANRDSNYQTYYVRVDHCD